jgi:hypothetical protein
VLLAYGAVVPSEPQEVFTVPADPEIVPTLVGTPRAEEVELTPDERPEEGKTPLVGILGPPEMSVELPLLGPPVVRALEAVEVQDTWIETSVPEGTASPEPDEVAPGSWHPPQTVTVDTT